MKESLDEADIAMIKESLKRSDKERFLMATRLFKIHKTMEKAKLTHKPFPNK